MLNCSVVRLALDIQLNGTMLSSARPTILLQNQPLVSDIACMTRTHQTRKPVTIGSITAHRNGLERAKLEHSSSQPIVGSAHKAFTGIDTSSLSHSAMKCVGAHSSNKA